MFDPVIEKKINVWLQGPFDEETKAAILKMEQKDPSGLVDAFYTDLSFGTGGLRGLMGPGPNRMNIYTVRKATQGLANYLLKQSVGKLAKVVIGFDSRHLSDVFAKETAHVFAANGIKVFLLQQLRPTPFVSFACRQLGCQAAVMVTASHNPAHYNGYKVYWSDGAQVVPPHDKGIMKEVALIEEFDQIKTLVENRSLIEIVDEELDEEYIKAIRPLQVHPELNRSQGKSLSIAFTSLHGTGQTLAPKALSDWGFTSIHYVKEQIVPNGDFPTVKFPNPEFPETLKLGIDCMQDVGADLLLATDPDADRLGVVVKHKGENVILNGNETSSLCVYYLCEQLRAQKRLPENSAIVTTIVSTELLKSLAQHYGIAFFEVLTGFKYIGEKIHEWETSAHGYHFLFGAEESYGYLLGTHARDKDAIVSCCLIAEMALWAKKQGKTLVDVLDDIYSRHGIYREKQHSIDFPSGKEGMEGMKALMVKLRTSPPCELVGQKIIEIEDYQAARRQNLQTKVVTPLTLPKSDVLLFRLEGGTKLIVRPSGTEPKLKIYAGVCVRNFPSIAEGKKMADERLDGLLEAFARAL